jgi:hypothetical protein
LRRQSHPFWGGSALLLILYTLAVGAPFFFAALVLGLVFHKGVAQHPIAAAIAPPVFTALIWFPLANSAGELFNGTRLAIYATFCAACAALSSS